ncbi:MAG: hypothetical protein COB24_11445 [Hyphomicrobiales bacterium]|nr:MAG: hypothetical protein COB24_11445 [Hyphomicrobiales bacterium]
MDMEILASCKCGQAMFDKSAGFPRMLGVVAAPFVAEPQMHGWTKSKLPHIKIPQNIKQYEKGIS